MKQTSLAKLQQATRENAVRLLHLDEADFCGIAPVQCRRSPRGLPHEAKPNHHCRRGVIGALNFGADMLTHATHANIHHRPGHRGFHRCPVRCGSRLSDRDRAVQRQHSMMYDRPGSVSRET